jgi:hemerythrin
MQLMSWKEEYSVGIDDIDKQHKRLIEMINELHDAMGAGHAQDILTNIFSLLIDYTKTHFVFEEKLLAAKGYPELSKHKTLHADLVSRVLVYKQKLESGQLGLSIEMMRFLQKWLNDHILVEDKKYSRYISGGNMKLAG